MTGLCLICQFNTVRQVSCYAGQCIFGLYIFRVTTGQTNLHIYTHWLSSQSSYLKTTNATETAVLSCIGCLSGCNREQPMQMKSKHDYRMQIPVSQCGNNLQQKVVPKQIFTPHIVTSLLHPCWKHSQSSLDDQCGYVLVLVMNDRKMRCLLCMRKPTIWVPTRSDTNRAVWAVQSQKQARSLKFWMYGEEELHYPCSENKGAETSYYEAYLRLCFRILQVVGFPMRRLIYQMIMGHILYQKLTFLMSFSLKYI